jgi:hypothetical protein
VGKRKQEKQAVTSIGAPDVGGRQSEAEAHVLLVSERLFNREPATVERDDIGGFLVCK